MSAIHPIHLLRNYPARPRARDVRSAFADYISRLTLIAPHRIPVGNPMERDFEDRAEHVRHVISSTLDYLRTVVDDVAENSTGQFDRSRNAARLTDAAKLLADLTSDVSGAAS